MMDVSTKGEVTCNNWRAFTQSLREDAFEYWVFNPEEALPDLDWPEWLLFWSVLGRFEVWF